MGVDSTSLFLRHNPTSGEWTESAHIRPANGNIQPAVVELSPGHLVSYSRRGGGYGPGTSGYLVCSESRDGGRTWSPGRDAAFPNPNAAANFIKLRSGNLLLVFNDSMTQRTPLVAALSTGQDRSYPHRLTIARGPNSYAYPVAIQTRDGKIHIIFTSDGRKVINHAVLEESEILGAR